MNEEERVAFEAEERAAESGEQGEEEMEEFDADDIEVNLGDEEIDELIGKLQGLKDNKGSITYELSEDVDLTINYEEDSGEDEEDVDGEEESGESEGGFA